MTGEQTEVDTVDSGVDLVLTDIMVEGCRLSYENCEAVTDWCHGRLHRLIRIVSGVASGSMYLEVFGTESTLIADVGDWIIRVGPDFVVMSDSEFGEHFDMGMQPTIVVKEG